MADRPMPRLPEELDALEALLGRVVAGSTFAASELPSPTDAEHAAPSAPSAPEEQPMLGLD